MENQTIPPIQPSYEITPNASLVPKPTKSWTKPILVSLIGILIAGGLVYAGAQIGKNQTPDRQPVIAQPTATPAEIVADPTAMPSPATISPAVDPTAGWKTYSNSQIGASIKYPSDWTMKEGANGKSVDFDTTIMSPEIVGGRKLSYQLNFQLEDPANFQAWSNDASTKKLESKIVNGLQFEQYIVADMSYSLNFIYRAADGKIFRLYLWPYTQSVESTVLDDTIVQVLSTFKTAN